MVEDLPSDDQICRYENGVQICVSTKSADPFEQSELLFDLVNENTRNMTFESVPKCKIQGIPCFHKNLSLLSRYIFLFLISALIVLFLHEIVHFLMFASAGEEEMYIALNVRGGIFGLENKPTVADHSSLWWFFALIGPSLIVNCGILCLNFMFFPPHYKTDSFYRMHVSITDELIPVFFKTMGYIAAIALIMDIAIFPFIDFYDFPFLWEGSSDFIQAWQIAQYFENEIAFRIVLILTTTIEASLSFLFVLQYGKKVIR